MNKQLEVACDLDSPRALVIRDGQDCILFAESVKFKALRKVSYREDEESRG